MNDENKLLNEGDLVLLVDTKDRRYLLTLESGSEFHSHSGFVEHNKLIGMRPGLKVRSTGGMEYLALIILTTGISITMIGGVILLCYIAYRTLND